MTTTAQPSLNLQRVYMKGLSLEMPNAPAIFLEPGQLTMHLDAQVSHEALAESVFEVTVRGTLTAKNGDKVVYLVEVLQAGIYEHKDIPAEHMAGVLNVACPTMLYPYLRVNIADAITRASLPPFHVPDVNWGALFEQTQQGQALAVAPTAGGVH